MALRWNIGKGNSFKPLIESPFSMLTFKITHNNPHNAKSDVEVTWNLVKRLLFGNNVDVPDAAIA